MKKTTRESAFSAMIRACARFVSACALLLEAVAGRVHENGAAQRHRGPTPLLQKVEEPLVAAARRPLEDDLLLASLRKLGFREAEVKEMASQAAGATLEDRVKSALSSRRSA